MSLWAILLTGLFAGGASCAAVQGGLLAGVVGRRAGPGVVASTEGGEGHGVARPRSTGVDDAVPVGAFLAGKLVSHAVLGAGLGLAGEALQFSPRTRAAMQILAGAVMVLLALNLLGWKALGRLIPSPPAAWARLVRRSGRWGGGLAPAALGVATVLIPCGVTLGMMFLAVASGSPLAGAAIMATFVVGTVPLFAVIGYAARRSTAYLRGRLGLLTGTAVLVAGLVSINTGLVLNGSSFTLAGLWRDVTGAEPVTPVAAPPVAADGVQRILIDAHPTGYSPSSVTARAGIPTVLTLRTDNNMGCTRTIVLTSFGGEQRVLPASGDTEVALGTLNPGVYRYTCGMGMYSGSITAVA